MKFHERDHNGLIILVFVNFELIDKDDINS